LRRYWAKAIYLREAFFGQYGDERVTEVGRYLDTTLEAALREAAEQ